jgi:DNA-binding transcriptional MerR regulator
VADGSLGKEDRLLSIQEAADLLGVTSRALRFYEDKGLIEPKRAGSMRIYAKREMGRVQLILRGKRLGFSLKLIKQFLDLYDADPQHVEQMRTLAGVCAERIADLEQQKTALELTIAELGEMRAQALEKVRRAE